MAAETLIHTWQPGDDNLFECSLDRLEINVDYLAPASVPDPGRRFPVKYRGIVMALYK